MFVEILFLIFGLLYLACKDAKYRQKIEEYNKTGWNVKSNRDLENDLFSKYCYEYEYVNKDKVPEKYRNFFRFNSKAMYDYFMSLSSRDVWEQGYRPYLFGAMPKEGFDFLEGFRQKYDHKVNEFNKHYDEICNRTAV